MRFASTFKRGYPYFLRKFPDWEIISTSMPFTTTSVSASCLGNVPDYLWHFVRYSVLFCFKVLNSHRPIEGASSFSRLQKRPEEHKTRYRESAPKLFNEIKCALQQAKQEP